MLNTLTVEQKDKLLKSLILFAVNSNNEVQLSEKFVEYASQAFDTIVDTELEDNPEENDRTYIFYKKEGDN